MILLHRASPCRHRPTRRSGVPGRRSRRPSVSRAARWPRPGCFSRNPAGLPSCSRPKSAPGAGQEIDSLITWWTSTAAPDSLDESSSPDRHAFHPPQRHPGRDPLPRTVPRPRGRSLSGQLRRLSRHAGLGDGPWLRGWSRSPQISRVTPRWWISRRWIIYRRITIGVVGTAMPAFETRFAGRGSLGRGGVRHAAPAPSSSRGQVPRRARIVLIERAG